jgi:Domain of unknown function (DUF4844)
MLSCFAMLLAVIGAGYSVMAVSADSVPLLISDASVAELKAFRAEPKFLDLPGIPAAEERRRLEPLINSHLDRLISGVKANPTETWVLEQMDPTVAAFHLEDTEARERCLGYIGRIFKILGIPNDRGAFRKHMIFW